MKKFLLSLVCAVSSSVASANGFLIAADSGAYDNFGFHDPTNTNFIAGLCVDCGGKDFHNFFVFDTSSVIGTVTAATLQINSGFVSSDGTYTVYDVTTPINELRAGGLNRLDIYQDLGSGVSYGQANLFATQNAQSVTIDIPLNAAAVAAINANRNFFALGGNYVSNGFQAFGGTDSTRRRRLILEGATVPIPGSAALLVIGLLGLARRQPSN